MGMMDDLVSLIVWVGLQKFAADPFILDIYPLLNDGVKIVVDCIKAMLLCLVIVTVVDMIEFIEKNTVLLIYFH